MKQVWIARGGGPEVLEVREAPTPEPAKGEIRVAVHAAGVNFADLMARMGTYPDGPPPPCVVGYEVSGVVEAVGEGVEDSWLGRWVIAATRFGGYSSHVVVSAALVAPLPERLSFAQGAALPVNGLTAWFILEEQHRVRAGDRILVHSAAGGVGLMAGQLIRRRGATAVGTASGSKHARLRERGWTELVDYNVEDYEKVLADGPPFDLVMDPLGGFHWGKGLRLLKSGGKVACYGMSVGSSGTVASRLSTLGHILRIPFWAMSPPGLINANLGVLGVNLGRMWDEAERMHAWLEALVGLVEAGELDLHVHAEVPFSRAAEAHQMIHDRKSFGKVVLVPDEVYAG